MFLSKYFLVLFLTFFVLSITILNQGCKKIGNREELMVSEGNIEEFLKLPANSSLELKVVLADLRRQLSRQNFAAQFVQWHGQPQWSKAIKLHGKGGFFSLLIPCIKTNKVTTFIVASQKLGGGILFELHRRSSLDNKIPEYSYIGLNPNKVKNYFSLLELNLQGKELPSQSGSTASSVNDECFYTWWQWEICPMTLTKGEVDTLTPTNNAVAIIQYCWVEHTYEWPDCEPGTGNPSGGGGGGGCTNCPQPPDCLNPYWYSFVPVEDPCDDNPPNPPTLTPCERVILGCQKASALFKASQQPNMAARKAEITSQFFPNIERCFWFGKNLSTDLILTTTNILPGPAGNNITVTPYPPSSLGQLLTYGAAHTHTDSGYSAPSPGDIYNFRWVNSINSNFWDYFNFSSGQNEYAFIVTDTVLFRNFGLNWSPDVYFDDSTGDWKEDTEIFIAKQNAFDYFVEVMNKTEDEAFELAQAFIARKYQTGLTIAKMDAQGNFKPIFVNEISDSSNPSNKTYQQTIICNLNFIVIEL